MASKRSPKEHIEQIRRVKFSIGGESNPVMEDLHHAVRNLSAELYAKDVHFLMELIQNAEDNEYPTDVKPSLEFILTSKDITATGVESTLIIFNNEIGFFERNIDSICSVGRSTKKGNRQQGYIGEKGIGFKSVYLITSQPYIFSNGYQIRFNEKAQPECSLGYIVPEWVESPTLSDIHQIYGSHKKLPTTTIVLPLKPEKVGAVRQQLSSIHPEVLLFLSKIRCLSFREDNHNPNRNTVTSVSISSETDFQTRKNIDAESFILHLCAEENHSEQESGCSYYMWRQKFPVRPENQIEQRMEVVDWVITLAFPFAKRLDRGMSSVGIYAFLPTEMITNFPFIIQADFILVSSRETILLGNKWNKGILDCVPIAFVSAFNSLVKGAEDAPISSIASHFNFLPVKKSSYPELNAVQEAIRSKIVAEKIMPCASHTQQKIFCKPSEVCRLMPDFSNILIQAMKQGVVLENLSTNILSSSFENAKFVVILKFLGIHLVAEEWYAKFIGRSNLVQDVSDSLYIKLLQFLADKWTGHFSRSIVKSIPLLKFVDIDGKLAFCCVNSGTASKNSQICLSSYPDCSSWMIKWNEEFRCAGGKYFVPEETQKTLASHSRSKSLVQWMQQHANVSCLTVYSYGKNLALGLKNAPSLLISFTHFLYYSLERNYLSSQEVAQLCDSMPLVDNHGHVDVCRKAVLIPAHASRWEGLLGLNPWARQKYVELSADYLKAGTFAGIHSRENLLMDFLGSHLKATDVPNLVPPNAAFASVSSPLTKENALLLLGWIRTLKNEVNMIPSEFLRCIKGGSWMKTSVGFKPPSECFLSDSEWGRLLQMISLEIEIPVIDNEYYDDRISSYTEELKTIGVMFGFGEVCQYIGRHLMRLAASSELTKDDVLNMLKFIQFLRETLLPVQTFINSVRRGSWLKTTQGYRSPVGSVLLDSSWIAISAVSNPPFIDNDYYGEEIHGFRTELQLLGVLVDFKKNYQLIAAHLRLPTYLTSLTAESALVLLKCIEHLSSSNSLAAKLKSEKWLKTNLGYRSPAESYLCNEDWGCLLKIFQDMPLIDEKFYGSIIGHYEDELEKVGVVVSLQDASKAVTRRLKNLLSSQSLTGEQVFSLLDCYRYLKGRVPSDLHNFIVTEKWLKTHLGYRAPKECILFDAEWESISPLAALPFVDASDRYYGSCINNYRDVLGQLGVVIKFESGSRFVAEGINIESPRNVTPASAFSLLKSIRVLLKTEDSLRSEFIKSINKKWVKTVMGFRAPCESMLFDTEWGSVIQREDGPFIDEAYYGPELLQYKNELKSIGIAVGAKTACSLLAGLLNSYSKFAVICRIYDYLQRFNWAPESSKRKKRENSARNSDSAKWIWIPQGPDHGEWVTPDFCVMHDEDDLFSSRLNVLDKFYDRRFTSFFSKTFEVRMNPDIEDYFKLWRFWETSNCQLVVSECCAFWCHVAMNWNHKTEKLLANFIKKVPVSTRLGAISLIAKRDALIPDELQLWDIFEKSSTQSLFVWYPQPSVPSLSLGKIFEIYGSIGVRKMSECVQVDRTSTLLNHLQLNKIDRMKAMISKGLYKVLLAFLADPSLEMPAEKRHEIVKQLNNVAVFESDEPITVSYSLLLSSRKQLCTKVVRMIQWDRENSKLFIQNTDRSISTKANIEFATNFSEVISEGLLWDKPDHISRLSELVQLGCLLDFDEEAVEFILRRKNLRLLMEDEVFLSSTLPSTC